MGKAFESIRQGLVEATQHARGRQAGVKVYQATAVDVAAVRGRLGFTQSQFAARFGFSVAGCGAGSVATAALKVRPWCC